MTEQPFWIDEPALALVAQIHREVDLPIANEPITAEVLNQHLARVVTTTVVQHTEKLERSFNDKDVLGFVSSIQALKAALYSAELALGIASEEHFNEETTAILKGEPADHAAILSDVRDRGLLYYFPVAEAA